MPDDETRGHHLATATAPSRPPHPRSAEHATVPDSVPDSVPDTVPDIVNTWASHDPTAPALLASGRPPLTYMHLCQHIATTARRLTGLGIGRAERVAVVVPNGSEMATAFLAIAATATCAPLNPDYTAADFAFSLSDLRARALVVLAGDATPAREAAARLSVPVIDLVPDNAGPAGAFTLRGTPSSYTEAREPAQPDDVALVLHTSGTTARSKIVPLTHQNLCASAQQLAAAFDLGSADRCLNVMPLFHVHGLVGALLSSLSAGGSVACTSGFDAARFFAWMEEFRPSWYTAVPTMHQAVLARAGHHTETIGRVPLRFIRSCSSALPPPVMRQLEATFGAPAIESYGMSEAAHQMASNPLPPAARKPGSVGIACGTLLGIMDEAGQLLPPGAIGEVVVRGPNIMRGYESNPETNARVFSDGWFRTGDQGYLDEEQYLYLTGRLKELINRGGEKIAPREIDEALLDHPAVAQALAFALPDAQVGEAVAAAAVLRPGAHVTELELMRFAGTRLAAFKVPQRIVFLDTLPKGPTGKLQRIGLAERLGLIRQSPSAPPEPREAPVETLAPRTACEATLVGIWAHVLSVESPSITDDFFELGGDSLQAARILARVQATFDVELPIAAFFATPTIAGLARMVNKTGGIPSEQR
jgi:acyl-CoA synthetase (AMP-forming)/AMP-acid ligase II/acyl carrier protein